MLFNLLDYNIRIFIAVALVRGERPFELNIKLKEGRFYDNIVSHTQVRL